MSAQTYSIKRAANIMELRNTYDDLLDEYYTLYKSYLGYKFTNNTTERKVEETLDVPTFNEVITGKTVDPKFVNLDKVDTGCGVSGCSPEALKIVENKCALNAACKGYTNRGELKSNVDDGNLVNFTIDGAATGVPMKLYKKKTTQTKIIPAATLAANARGRLDVLKSKIDAILAELKQNIDSTDLELKDHSDIVDKKRTEILSRNKEIQKQDKDLEAINLKLISRRRQNEFSLERNKYRKVMLVMLVVANIILLGYFGHLLTKS